MRHHYVPQFLLRAWADTMPDGKVEVFRLDLSHLPSSRLRPRYTGFENDLYALTLPVVAGMEQQAVEKHFLRHVDTRAFVARAKLHNAGLKALSRDERRDWVCFLMSLRLRQPDIVVGLRQDAATHLRQTLQTDPQEYDEVIDADDPPTLEEWTEKYYPGLIENFGLSFFHKLVTDTAIGTDIIRMKWWLWDFSRTGRELLLADRPCILTASLKNPDCVLALPISPTKAFLATRSRRVADIIRAQDPKHLAMRLNESSLSQARNRIYSRDA
jgi:hypothetical protein